MAFRRKFSKRFRRPFRRAPVARVRRTWRTALVPTVCNQLEVPLEPCPVEDQTGSLARIVLVDNTTLESSFSDRARVKRVVGDLWFAPTWDDTTPSNCAQHFLAALSAYYQTHIGLRRFESNRLGSFGNFSPLTSDYDYSEAQWLKTWQHVWIPEATVDFIPSFTQVACAAVLCPDVHTAGILDNDFVEGTGTINIETDCGDPQTITCDAVQPNQCNSSVKFPRPWHVHFDIKKSVPLRENMGLALDMEFIAPNSGFLVNPRMQIFGGLKVLLQY